jgi:signal transduction histidine kinase
LELDQLKTQFFANVSHELRTPLTLILGPLRKMLADTGLTETQRRDMEVIERNATTLLKHVNDLLDISKLEAGEMKLQYADVDLAHMTRLAASHFETRASDGRIRYTVDAPGRLAGQTDPEKMQRILLNLISNAFKFTPAGGSIKVALKKEEGRARFEVVDSGPGVPENMRSEVFERFRQVDGSASRIAGGTGLGLSIVKEFVSLHGGEVTVADAPAGGAVFTVTVPLTAPSGADVAVAAVDFDTDTVRQAIGAEPSRFVAPISAPPGADVLPTVLVVEDNRDMSAFLAESLSRAYSVATAFDGREGLARALELRPDVILSDMMMPFMSGEEMVRELRALPEFDTTPIIFLTAKTDDSLRVKLLNCGVQDYLSKPFSTDELLARVGRLVAERLRDRAVTFAWQHAFLRDILHSVTEGKLNLCDSAADLPARFEACSETIPLVPEALSEVRASVVAAASSLNFEDIRMYDLISAASEAAMNAVTHAGGGSATICTDPAGTVQVWIADHGAGIDLAQLPQATLEKGYTTTGTLGHGFFLILKSVDRLYLLTGPTGTTIVLEQERVEPEPAWMRMRFDDLEEGGDR